MRDTEVEEYKTLLYSQPVGTICVTYRETIIKTADGWVSYGRYGRRSVRTFDLAPVMWNILNQRPSPDKKWWFS